MPKAEHQPVLDAIETITAYLDREWIVEECAKERVLFCASCTMTRLRDDLRMLSFEVENIDSRGALIEAAS